MRRQFEARGWQADPQVWIKDWGVHIQVIGLADAHNLAANVKAGPRNQEMQVRMKLHALVPGMEYGGKPADVRPQSLGGSKLLGQRLRARGKEQKPLSRPLCRRGGSGWEKEGGTP
jgi:hypothetical protein